MSDIWTAIGAISALIAAVAASLAGYFTYRIMLAGQRQVQVSQTQNQQTLEAERDAQLPVLMPTYPIMSVGYSVPDQSGVNVQPTTMGYDREQPFARIKIINAGPGIAVNVWGIVFEPEPALDLHKTTGQHHSHRYNVPIRPSEEITRDWKGGGLPVRGDTEIGGAKRYKLYAPSHPSFGQTLRGKAEKSARLTLTYSDIFGRKHAAIYDLTAQMEWENVAYLRNIPDDLGDLEREALSHIPVFSAPSVPTVITEAQAGE